MNQLWIVFALLGAILWGIDYSIAEKVLEKISVATFISIQLLCAFIVTASIAYFSGNIRRDLNVLVSNKSLFHWFIVGVLAFIIANVLICLAIQNKNATVTGLVEISYPLFIIFFSWLFFRAYHLTLATLLGGILIIAGIFVIYFQKI